MMISGRAFWAKVLNAPVASDMYPEQGRSWSVDVSLDKTVKKQLTDIGLAHKFKNKKDDRGDFISFRRKEFKSDGETKNQPIKIVDSRGQDWDPKVFIGNGSEVNVRFNTFEDRKKNLNPAILAIQVVKLVPYAPKAGDFDDFPVYDTEDEVIA